MQMFLYLSVFEIKVNINYRQLRGVLADAPPLGGGPIHKALANESSDMARIERDKATLKQQLNRKLQDHMYDDDYKQQHELCLGLGPPADAV